MSKRFEELSTEDKMEALSLVHSATEQRRAHADSDPLLDFVYDLTLQRKLLAWALQQSLT